MGLLRASSQSPGFMPQQEQWTSPPGSTIYVPQQPRGSLPGAFSASPDFQNQLQSIMQMQGPGMQQPQFTPPPFLAPPAPMTDQQQQAQRPKKKGLTPFGALGGLGLNF